MRRMLLPKFRHAIACSPERRAGRNLVPSQDCNLPYDNLTERRGHVSVNTTHVPQQITGVLTTRRSFLGIAGGAFVTLAGLGLAGCGASGTAAPRRQTETITAVGSTALQPLVEAAAEQLHGGQRRRPNLPSRVGGSGQGNTQISQGAVQIGNSDVFAETKLDNPDDASKLKDNQVAVVGMGPVAHSELRSMTFLLSS